MSISGTVPHFFWIAFFSLRRFFGSGCGSGSVNLMAPPRWRAPMVTHGSLGMAVSRAPRALRISAWSWAVKTFASRGLFSFS
ncbi:hypothetical protein [Streptomyces sp. CB02959]|uniref:hypothetical protein n=1 Tax=Streptomyces sp. CB02959 TaxID=2020330 RepID=UPI0011AFCF45|nr:hypothetical protein [Streptomyces sp. CB02959]